jgi:hypothetical protein
MHCLRGPLPRMISPPPLSLVHLFAELVPPKTSTTSGNAPSVPNQDPPSLKDTCSCTIFQECWLSKSVVRAYHGDYIKEKCFKCRYLPDTIPDVWLLRAIKRGDDKASL